MSNAFNRDIKILLATFFIVVLIGNGCDYLFRGAYPDTYPDTVWVSENPEWTMIVNSKNSMTSVMITNDEQLELCVGFDRHQMYVYLKDAVYVSDCIFRGSGVFKDDKFIIYEIYDDKLFDFKYEKIVFIRLNM